jgi:hypothetical protein
MTEEQAYDVKERFSALTNSQGFRVFRAGIAEGYSFILDASLTYKTPT